jgi:hypothetical protein
MRVGQMVCTVSLFVTKNTRCEATCGIVSIEMGVPKETTGEELPG